jgi:hypothetical protein
VYRRSLREVSESYERRINALREDMERFSKHSEVQTFIDDIEELREAAEDFKEDLFDVEIETSIDDLYNIDSEIKMQSERWEEFKEEFLLKTKSTTTTTPSTTIAPEMTLNPSTKRNVDLICDSVEQAKKEISLFSPEQCSGHKLMPQLIDCQSNCNVVKKYYMFNQVYSISSFQDDLKFIQEKCEAVVNVWNIIRSIRELFFQF